MNRPYRVAMTSLVCSVAALCLGGVGFAQQKAASPAASAAASLKPSIHAHCFCRLACGTGAVVLRQTTDPNHTYIQLGNKQNKECRGYCQGLYDNRTPTQVTADYQQCQTNTCTSTVTMFDAVGTGSYWVAKSGTIQGVNHYACPTGQTLAFDHGKCGTLLGPAFPPNLANQYLLPNYFVTAGKVYQITQAPAHSCTF